MTSRKLIIFLLFLNLALRLLFLTKPFVHIDGIAIPDDAYLFLKISQNLAEGNGFLYTDSQTNGFQPLYVLIMSPVYLLTNDLITPVYAALTILSLFNTLALLYLIRILNLLNINGKVTFILACIYITSPVIIRTSVNGMETAAASFFIFLILYQYYRHFGNISEASPVKLFLFGLAAGFAFLARIDNLLLILSGIPLLLYEAGKNRTIKSLYKPIIMAMSGFSAVAVPWLIIMYKLTGLIYPVSGSSVRFQSLSKYGHNTGIQEILQVTGKSLWIVITNHILLFAVIALCAVIYLFLKRSIKISFSGIKLHIPLFLFSLMLFSVYTFYFLRPLDRYLYGLVPLMFIITASVLHTVSSLMQNDNRRRNFLYGLLTVSLLFNVTRPGFTKIYFSGSVKPDGYYGAGIWARNHFDKGTVIGAVQSGAFSYFAPDLKVYNIDGVTDIGAYRALLRRDIINYIKEKNIQYFIGWDINYKFVAEESSGFREGDMVKINEIPDITSLGYRWYVYKVTYGK